MREERRPPAATRRDDRPRLGLRKTGTDGTPGEKGGCPGTIGGTGTDTPGGLGTTAPGGSGGPATAVEDPTLSVCDEQEHELGLVPLHPQAEFEPPADGLLTTLNGDPLKSGTEMSGIQPPTRRRRHGHSKAVAAFPSPL